LKIEHEEELGFCFYFILLRSVWGSIYSVLSDGFEKTKKAHGFLLPCAEWCVIWFYGGSNHYRMGKHPFYIYIFAKKFTRQNCPKNSKKPRFSRGFLWLYLFYSLFMKVVTYSDTKCTPYRPFV